jgi:unsaturated rhamnogalacturonyl hydrolase
MRRVLPFSSARRRLGCAWIALAFSSALTAAAAGEPAADVRLLERVADWQLQHPCSFDLRWQAPGQPQFEDLRIGWDGKILRRRTLPMEPTDATPLPEAWAYLTSRASGNIAFEDLPPAVRKAWQNTGLDPRYIFRLRLMDEGATRSWEMATLYVGLLALGDVSAKPVYRAALRQLAEAQHWQLAPRVYHADDLLLGYLYLDLYERERRTAGLAAVQSRVDWLRAHPSSQSLDIREGQDRWAWSDALFMAPPVWLRLAKVTGDRGYLEFMDREWWATVDYLFSTDDRLFFRDAKFFPQREPNGEKIFWSRGNAWVLASLALMLEDLPADLPSRARYVQLFQKLAGRIAALQPADGLWRSSLLDPTASPQPESSSTAFFCYAFARGIRLGLLDAGKFGPIVDRTWTALQGCVQPDGRLGYVQQPGAAPGTADEFSTAPYGVGAFLLAGTEIHRLRHP